VSSGGWQLRRELGRIRALGVEVLAISDERVIEAKRIAAELGHDITILSDRNRWVGHRYGMRDAERRFALTAYVIIDGAGRVRARRLDPRFGEHGDEIVNILEEAARSDSALTDSRAWHTVCYRSFTVASRSHGGERAAVNVERSRIVLLIGAVALAITSGVWSSALGQPLPPITVYKSPT
jgi:hypothetical protein